MYNKIRRPRKMLKDSRHAYRQEYLWDYVNPHVPGSSNYQEFERGAIDAEFKAKVDGGYFDEH